MAQLLFRIRTGCFYCRNVKPNANNSNAHLDFHKRVEHILAVTLTVVPQQTVVDAIVLGFQTHRAGFKNT